MKYSIVVITCIGVLCSAEQSLKKSTLERLAMPKVSYEGRYLSSAKVDDGGGSVAVASNKLQVNNFFINFEYTNWQFDWANVDELPFGNGVDQPIKAMNGLKLDVRLPYKFNDRWFSLTSIGVSSIFEQEMYESLSYNLFSFVSYKLSDEHTFTMGAFGYYNPTASLVLPIISYGYRARQRNGLSLILGFPRTFLGYHVTPELRLSGGFIFSSSVARLKNESPIASKGYIQFSNYLSNLGVTYDLFEHLQLNADLLYSLRRDMTIFQNSGTKLGDYYIDPSFGVNIKATWLF